VVDFVFGLDFEAVFYGRTTSSNPGSCTGLGGHEIGVSFLLIVVPVAILLVDSVVDIYNLQPLISWFALLKVLLLHFDNFLLILSIMRHIFHLNSIKILIPTIIMLNLTLPAVILIAVIIKVDIISSVVRIVADSVVRVERGVGDVVSLPDFLLVLRWEIYFLLLVWVGAWHLCRVVADYFGFEH
jgi:hypothetical protein